MIKIRLFIHWKGAFTLRSNKGASSVLVILMMVVLIALGLAALTTSLAAMRLGDKSGEWYEAFYALDNMAEVNLAVIDGYIKEADTDAKDYMQGTHKFELSDDLITVIDGKNIDAVIYKLVFWYRLGALLGSSDIEITENGPAKAVSDNRQVNHIPVIRFSVAGSGRIDVTIEIYGQEHDERYNVSEWIYLSRVSEKQDD